MKLLEVFGERIKENEALKNRTTYRLGGPAKFLLEVKTAEEAQAAIRAAREDGLPVFVLGGGSNILFSDDGFKGLVLSIAARGITFGQGTAVAEAGASLGLLVNRAVAEGRTGLEWAAGIPGTVGGAVRGNAGAYGGETKDVAVSVEAINLETGERRAFTNAECGFAYRDSSFKRTPWLIWSALFRLPEGEREASRKKVLEIINLRRNRYPTQYGNAGSVFKNVVYKDLDELPEKIRQELPSKYQEFHRVPAAWLIERLELKGKAIGGARVSDLHANYVVNTGAATAEQVIELISYVKMKVRDEYGIQLQEEIEYGGFGLK